MSDRLSDAQVAEHKQLAKDLRLHAKHIDDVARADRERGDLLSERMWKMEAKSLRTRAREHDDALASERFWRRIERSTKRMGTR